VNSLQLHWSAATLQGKRKPGNEDSLIVLGCNRQYASQKPCCGTANLTNEDILCAVADGMGGGVAGDLASRYLIEHLLKFLPRTFRMAANALYPDYLGSLGTIIDDAQSDLLAKTAADPALHGMASTLSIAWFTPDNLYIAHVGDSRIYLCRNGSLTQLTRDHSIVGLLRSKRKLNEYQARTHPRRNVLLKVMGGNTQGLHPMLLAQSINKNDTILLCSDGLINGLWDRQIKDLLCESPHPVNHAQYLVNQAQERDPSDDITAIVIHIL